LCFPALGSAFRRNIRSLGDLIMTPNLLRQLWTLVETTQAQIILRLDDASLVQWLLKQIKQERSLNPDEANVITDYLQSKLSLIRDLAHERQSA
jgi:hypothetical protein